MLQDLTFGKLENDFRKAVARDSDIVICVRDRYILAARREGGCLQFPNYAQVMQWSASQNWESWGFEPFQYVFCVQDNRYFLWMGSAGACDDSAFSYQEARKMREYSSKDQCFAAMTAWHLYTWYRNNRYCGRCGIRTIHDSAERMVRCPECGNMIFPRISPAVIVAVTNGDRLLLSKYAGRSYAHYALLAGYTEIGETLEETVHREVMEEVGLRVKNIRYYKSQPWGIDGNILMGFFCDVDGDDTIRIDERELAMAQWYERSALPAKDDGISLTREMIRVFEEGVEPKSAV